MRRNLASTAVRSDIFGSRREQRSGLANLNQRLRRRHSRRVKRRASRERANSCRTGVDKAPCGSIAIVVRFEGAALGHADVGGLLGSQAGKRGADLAEVQPGDLLVEVLGK